MKLHDWAVYRGPNVVALRACARLVAEEEADDAAPLTDGLRATALQLLNALPCRPENRRQQPFAADTAAAFVVEVALALQVMLDCHVFWGETRRLDAARHELAFDVMRPTAAREIALCALALLDAARATASAADLAAAFAAMRAEMSLRLRHFVLDDRKRTAARLGIERCSGYGLHYSFLRLGHGHRTRLLAPGYTDATPYLSREIAGDKNDAYNILVALGLPVARQLVASSESKAVAAARGIGFPVVVKPQRGNRGRGVSVNLRDEEAVRQAYPHATNINSDVVVEQYLLGDDYRLLVIGGKFAAALRRPPPGVVGDGSATVAALIEQTNAMPIRDDIFLNRITLDAEVLRTLESQGLDLDAVPAAGRQVLVRRAATPESMVEDVTDSVHPDNRAAAELAAQACCGLDVSGVDFISSDIAVSWKTNRGGIVEVNAGPGVDLHMFPQSGRARDISFRMIRSRVAARTAGRIPTVMVTGRHDKRPAAQWVANLLALLGYRPGLVDPAATAPLSYYYESKVAATIHVMLADRNVGAGIFDISLRDLAQDGVPIHYPDVVVLTDDLPPDWDADAGPDLLARLHRLAVDIACTAVVVDGRKPGLRAASASRPAWQVGYIWLGEPKLDLAPLETHLAKGGWAVVEEFDAHAQAWIVLRQGDAHHPLARIDALHWESADDMNSKATLIACATAIALGASATTLERGVHAAAYRCEQTSSLMIDPCHAPWLAACDPRDAVGLRRLALVADGGDAKRKLWSVMSAYPWAEADAMSVLRGLEAPQTHWCCIGPAGAALAHLFAAAGVAPERIATFPNLERARASLLARAAQQDIVALIEMNPAERFRWCPLDMGAPLPPLVEHPSAASAVWQAADLARICDGFWVSGPRSGWGVDALAYDHETELAGKLVAVPGSAVDDGHEAGIAALEERVRQAFIRGAAAVVAPLLPVDLPRWRHILVCDDVDLGMERLMRLGRGELP